MTVPKTEIDCKIEVGDVVQVDPDAPSDFAGCFGIVDRCEGPHIRIVVPRPWRFAARGLVLLERVSRIGVARWVGPFEQPPRLRGDRRGH